MHSCQFGTASLTIRSKLLSSHCSQRPCFSSVQPSRSSRVPRARLQAAKRLSGKSCRCQVHTVQSEPQSTAATAPAPYKVPTYVRATGRIIASKPVYSHCCQHCLSSKLAKFVTVLHIRRISSRFVNGHRVCDAVGDIHGDMRKAISSLEAARVLEEIAGQVRWAGGDTVVVQLGDVLDRGDSEIGELTPA